MQVVKWLNKIVTVDIYNIFDYGYKLWGSVEAVEPAYRMYLI